MATEEARPLCIVLEGRCCLLGEETPNLVMTSEKSHIPNAEAATPRTAEETIWVIGEVTLMDNKLAMLIKNPNKP
jgi:hypothetical protein